MTSLITVEEATQVGYSINTHGMNLLVSRVGHTMKNSDVNKVHQFLPKFTS